MDYDSGSSCEERVRNLECSVDVPEKIDNGRDSAELKARSVAWYGGDNPRNESQILPPALAKKDLSSQVMDYCKKYSQHSGLGRYFSLAEPSTSMVRATDYNVHDYCRSGANAGRILENYTIAALDEPAEQDSSLPRERRRWMRPPLVGRPSSTEGAISSVYIGVDSRITASVIKKRVLNETILEEANESAREASERETKASVSPASSVASHKPLEWDSGADVGYFNSAAAMPCAKGKKLCDIEHVALAARGTSVAGRLDPEGTNETAASSRNAKKMSAKPDANSTPLIGHTFAKCEDDIRITPIAKCRAPMIAHEGNSSAGRDHFVDQREISTPGGIEYSGKEDSRSKETLDAVSRLSPLKKSTSMNVLTLPFSRLSLKRSQSELNLCAKEKSVLPLIFNSTSSIATIVNKPATRNKLVQTSLDARSHESIGIQVEVTAVRECEDRDLRASNGILENRWEKREEKDRKKVKSPSPQPNGSLGPRSLHSILKKDKEACDLPVAAGKTQNSDESTKDDGRVNNDEVCGQRDRNVRGKIMELDGSPEQDQSSETKSEILPGETLEEIGRACNSFEYFSGNVCSNGPNGICTSRMVSSSETGRESGCSTMPNTSSSIDERLWGDSDSLVKDLERSVNILKSLVDANKCEKQVKKRLIHHVIKRLVTAKYRNDRIERDLEENLPWNPADARNKVYRNDIIQALASNEQQHRPTTDSSAAEEWTPRKRNVTRIHSAGTKKNQAKEVRAPEEVIGTAPSSRDRDTTNGNDEYVFDDHGDRMAMDGRKARMSLRSENRDSHTDGDRSQSSECFVPHSQQKSKSTNVFYSIVKGRESPQNKLVKDGTTNLPAPVSNTPTMTGTGEARTTASTTSATSTSASHNSLMSDRIILVKERRRTDINETDWRLPTTMSERRFELGRFGHSESGDAKLINYAEMEKRNQLVWITNEISHLCNLKRLLEDSHNKVESRSRGGGTLPRKRLEGSPITHWIAQSRHETNFSSHSERTGRTGSAAAVGDAHIEEESKSVERILGNQWSSHRNLASARSERPRILTNGDDGIAVGHTRKRNSCTQTGSDGGPSGHSTVGGEIVSGALPSLPLPTMEKTERSTKTTTRDVSVQTRSDSDVKNIAKSSAARNQDARDESKNGAESCTTSRQKRVCYCQRYAVHSRHRACLIHSPQRSHVQQHTRDCPRRLGPGGDSERPIITQSTPGQCASSPKRLHSRKETKNQLNATCKSNYAVRVIPARDENDEHCGKCKGKKILSMPKEQLSQTRTRSSEDERSTDICVCSEDCSCEQVDSDDGNRIVHRETSASSCCENKTVLETEASGENSPPGRSCTCNFKSHTRQPPRRSSDDADERFLQKTIPAIGANGVEKVCKSCRTCGTIWPIVDGKHTYRSCKCSQDYLKPVAYELSFNETNSERPRNIEDKKVTKSDKIISVGTLTKNKLQAKATKSASMVEKTRGQCTCERDESEAEKNKGETKGPDTLKDFLATNKPKFLENVETRRRYMNELSQLRQLKREKRKQFLAVAGASDFLKPQRSVKSSTAGTQRKLSEHEMKIRLRSRYLCLNEVRNKKRQREKEEDARRNHLMAKLFGQKLQQKVLKGQVDLSQSVSVISNL